MWTKFLNTTLRSNNDVWLTELTEFTEKVVSVVKSAGLLATQGGPIIMMQIENEYGNMESYYGESGHQYVQTLAQFALGLEDTKGIPWIMCQQGEGVGTAPPAEIVNSCNGFYCDNWISSHAAAFPNQPHMFTENWPGWFQNWGEPIPHRPAVDIAFSVARWFARGGSYMNYYMAFGGTTFGRHPGGPLIVTSYDYDVQINEYAMRAEPKFTLLQQLHSVLHENAQTLLSELPPSSVSISPSCESHTYGSSGDSCIAFYSNWGEKTSCQFTLPDGKTTTVVPPWSVSIATGENCVSVVYNTKTSAQNIKSNHQTPRIIDDFAFETFRAFQEPIPSSIRGDISTTSTVHSKYPMEQLSLTMDSTDYLWYSTTIPGRRSNPEEAILEFQSGEAGGGVMYVFIDGQLAATTLGATGEPPIGSSSTDSASSDAEKKVYRRGTNGFIKTASGIEDKSTVLLDGSMQRNGDINMAGGVKVTVNVTLPAGSDSKLDILSVSMGIKNYGPYLELISLGIVSNITINDKELFGFKHSVGLRGDPLNMDGKVSDTSTCTSLCWYSSVFSTPPSSLGHLALDMSSVSKGAVWVNGFMLGRFWNLTATPSKTQGRCESCDSARYVGSYNGDRCRSGCGGLSQQFYKLPSDVLYPYGSGQANKIVVFGELGGNPDAIRMVNMEMQENL